MRLRAAAVWAAITALALVTGLRGQDAGETPETARTLGLGTPVEIALRRDDSGYGVLSYFAVDLEGAAATTRFDVALSNPTHTRTEISLLDETAMAVDYVNGDTDLRLRSYVLPPGRHVFSARVLDSGGPSETPFTLMLEPKGTWQPGEEREPNRTIALASPGRLSDGIRGEIESADDKDTVALNVNDALQLWTIEATGPGAASLALLDASGQTQKSATRPDAQSTAQMWSLLLPPGQALFTVSGEAGPWQLKATPAGQVPLDILGGDAKARAAGEIDEVEPNGGPDRALMLKLDSSRAGQIEGSDDQDVYRFTLDAEARVRMTLKGRADMRLRAQTMRGTTYWEAGQITVEAQAAPSGEAPAADGEASASFLLPQGDYYVYVRGDRREPHPYELGLSRLPYFADGVDFEPNAAPATAKMLPADLRAEGTLNAGDVDLVRLPDLDRPATLTATIETAPRYFTIGLRQENRKVYASGPIERTLDAVGDMAASADGTSMSIELPPGKDRLLYINAGAAGRYRVAFAFSDGPTAVLPSSSLGVTLGLTVPRVAAFARSGQRIPVVLNVHNDGTAAVDAALALHLSDDRWTIEGAPPSLSIEPGATAKAEFALLAPPQLFEGRVVVSAKASAGPAVSSAEGEIAIAADAQPASPQMSWTLPDALLGGIDVAWSALGATVTPGREALIDGYATGGTAAKVEASDAPEDVTVIDLAGDAPVALKGLIVNPTIGPDLTGQVRRLAVEASTDGTSFTRIFEGEVGPRQREYAFVFPQPVQATQLRVLPLEPVSYDYTASWIGEFKAIADPGLAATLAPAGFNLADPRLGGHIIQSEPENLDFSPILAGEASPALMSFGIGDLPRLEWTIGFMAQRAARLARLEWSDAEGLDPGRLISDVRIETAMDARGPYEEAGVWHIDRSSGAPPPFAFASPGWARFVRMSVVIPDTAATGDVYMFLPRQVAIYEAPSNANDGTIVGEWGDLVRNGPFERRQPPPAPEIIAATGGGESRDKAKAIQPGTKVGGRVSAGERGDWWSIDVPQGALSLALTLSAPDRLGAVATIEDSQGRPVPVSVERDDGRIRKANAAVTGGRYIIHVDEPPRSLAVVWDTSGSVGPYIPAIIQSIRGFARYLRPGRDEASLLPFREPEATPLLSEWTGDPVRAFGALNGYDWADSSSNAEGGVIGGAQVLANRPGARALILITDYASNGSTEQRAKAIDLLRNTGSRVYNVAIPSGSGPEATAQERALAQTFAAFSGGTLTYAGTSSDLEDAFARAVADLRSTKDYTMVAEIGFEPPEPGRVRVTIPASGGAAAAGATVAPRDRAVLVIFDASGSMLARIGKKSRIEVAKDVLNELTQAMLPEGTPFAMRVFGDVKKGSCETNLRLPLAPLDRTAAKAVVDKVRSISGAKTAIGASLAVADQDLAAGQGQKLILLITDGEETCGGKPKDEIERLRAAGIDARISVIGFAVDDAALKKTFADWSEAGGGAYYDADKPEALAEAVRRALLPSFDVVDAAGNTIATGLVGGGEVEVPPGTYTIRVMSDPPRDYPNVVISSGKTASVAFE